MAINWWPVGLTCVYPGCLQAASGAPPNKQWLSDGTDLGARTFSMEVSRVGGLLQERTTSTRPTRTVRHDIDPTLRKPTPMVCAVPNKGRGYFQQRTDINSPTSHPANPAKRRSTNGKMPSALNRIGRTPMTNSGLPAGEICSVVMASRNSAMTRASRKYSDLFGL
jgi:hypothetical protein